MTILLYDPLILDKIIAAKEEDNDSSVDIEIPNMNELLVNLKPILKEVVIFRLIKNKTFQFIADKQNTSKSTSYRRYLKAIKILRSDQNLEYLHFLL